MRISHRHKFVFFSSPKTGSESIRNLLDPLSDVRGVPFRLTTPTFPFHDHIRPIDVKAAFATAGWDYDSYYRFVFVRNPWTRLVSLYQYACVDPRFNVPFGKWLKASRPSGAGGGGSDGFRWLKYGTYTLDAYAGDGNGRLLVDEVFRLEDIATVPDRLRARGIPLAKDISAPWVNRTKGSTDLSAFYTPKLVDLVGQRYAKEIAEFGYKYPGD